MKKIELTASEIKTLELFLLSNPCSNGCAYPEMQNSKKECSDCKLIKDNYPILKKLDLV